MARVRARSVSRPRSQRVLDSLTAAGVRVGGAGPLPMIDVGWAGLATTAFYDAVMAADHSEVTSGGWPCETPIADVGHVVYREHDQGVFRLEDGSIVHLTRGDTWLNVRIATAAGRRERGAELMAAFQTAYPPLYLTRDDEAGVVVPVTFWMLSSHGPDRRLRRIAATDWPSIERNYTADVQAEIDRLTADDFAPGEQGQLLLWYGPPGTGKTWAIRALAHAWSPWAEFHVITDPDAFFVQDASYMVDVLLHESYEAIDQPTGDLVSTEAGEKWRVLILEDTGELMSADAKTTAGQGLSRLLNVVDGMIGQGLRILVLVTTNDEIESLHPAVRRPGRCASQLIFGPLSAEEATAWAGEPIDQPMSLAELYARGAGGEDAFVADPDEPDDGHADLEALDPLTQAAVDAASGPLPELADPPTDLEAAAITADVTATLREMREQGGMAPDLFLAALEGIAASHRTTTEAVAALVAAAVPDGRQATTDAIALSAVAALERMAARPPAAPAPVHVHVPEQPVTVTVEAPRIEPHFHVPEQAAPVVHVDVAAAEAPHVDVHVAAAEPAPAPDVHVHVPPAEAANVQVDVHVPEPKPRTVRVVEDPENGERSYVAE